MRHSSWLPLCLLLACSSSNPGAKHDTDSSHTGDGDSQHAGDGDHGGDGDHAGDGDHHGGDGDHSATDAGPTGDGDVQQVDAGDPDKGVERRELTLAGLALSYAPYRHGQVPGGFPAPSDAQILEDLTILARHFQVIRMYGAGDDTATTVRLIDEHQLPLKVMVGAWLNPETDEGVKADNEAEVERALQIAADHPNVVGAISVANEVLVDWSTHKVDLDRVIYFVRKARAGTTLPVTTADNYVWWRNSGAELAKEVDFITIHTYPFWERYDIDLNDPNDHRAIDYTEANYHAVRYFHPRIPIVVGEAGWATADNGNVQIVPGAGSEAKQKVYYTQLMDWAKNNNVLTFVFEAFDEKWKGGSDASEPEKNWGLFFENRTPKQVLKELYGDLAPTKL